MCDLSEARIADYQKWNIFDNGILKIEQRNERECESEVNKYFLSQDNLVSIK